LGLIGPNGAGKTTLFQCLAGLLPADEGVVSAGDREVEAGERSSVLLFLPDGISPWHDQPVRWVLDFATDAWRAEREWRGEIADVLRLPELAGRRIGELSKGQRKRVMLAIALMAPQQIALIDEPFDGLDLRHAREVSAYFHAQSRAGRTLFLATAAMHEAAKLCDRLVLLNDGAVAAEGTLDELQARSGKPDADLEEVFLALT
jgi:ABC-2 type transport system ATP-binding protein